MTFTYGATTITVLGAIYPLKVDWSQRQNIIKMEDGSVDVYDRSKFQLFYKLVIASAANYTDVRNFIRTTVSFSKYSFNVTPDAGVDLGAGDGVAVPVRYWGQEYEDEVINKDTHRTEILLRYGQ
jgi:hypothetical protein